MATSQRATHTHNCAIPGCALRVPCRATPNEEGAGDRDAEYRRRVCPAAGDRLCEDHADWTRCDRCGVYTDPANFVQGLCLRCRCRYCGGDPEDEAHEQAAGCPHEAVYVRCDESCRARQTPTTPEEYIAAYRHWRFHQNLGGCSHGR